MSYIISSGMENSPAHTRAGRSIVRNPATVEAAKKRQDALYSDVVKSLTKELGQSEERIRDFYTTHVAEYGDDDLDKGMEKLEKAVVRQLKKKGYSDMDIYIRLLKGLGNEDTPLLKVLQDWGNRYEDENDLEPMLYIAAQSYGDKREQLIKPRVGML